MKKILIGVLSVFLIIIILSMCFYVITFQGVVGTIVNVIGSIVEAAENFVAWVKELPRNIVNAWNEIWDKDSFSPPKSEEITMVLSNEYVDEMKKQIESKGINLKSAGLEDIQLKKMVLTSFKTFATNTTEVALIITKDEYNDLKDEDEGETFYRIKTTDNNGNEQYCIATKGVVKFQIETTDENGNESLKDMYCYTQDSLNEIQKKYNEKIKEDPDSDFAKAIKRHLEKSYTVETMGAIKILTKESTTTYEAGGKVYTTSSNVEEYYKNSGVLKYKSSEDATIDSNTTVVQYSENISEYIMPMELLSSMLEITASPEFILKVCDLVANSKFVVAVYPETVEEIQVNEKQYNVNVDIALGENGEDIKKIEKSKVCDIERIRTVKKTYNVVTKSINTWWCKVTANVNKTEEEYFVGEDKNGNIFDDKEELENLWRTGNVDVISSDIEKKWNDYDKTKNFAVVNNFLEMSFYGLFDYKINDYNLEVKLNDSISNDSFVSRILQTEYKALNSSDERMSLVKNVTLRPYDILERQYTTTTKKKYSITFKDKEDKTDKFVKLLKDNNTGKDVTYSDLYGDDETAVGKLLVNGAEMLFEILESFENSKETADIMRYILYLYSNENYGVSNFYDLLNLFGNMSAVSGSSSTDLLIAYIHSWEGTPKMSSDGTKYIVFNDGYGNPTVGWGVDINSHNQVFSQAGYSASIGSEIEKEFVDSIEEGEVNSNIDYIKSIASGLDLTGYQINALVSRSYNCDAGPLNSSGGSAGAVGIRNGKNFVQAYNAYWNKDTDDKFEEKDSNADFNHNLYTQYMCKPDTSKGQHSDGLVNRRKSEWTLFQTGYYDRIDEWHTDGGGSILECAKMIHEYMETNGYTYCVYGGNSGEECGKNGKSHGLSSTFEASKTNKNTCCATYVSWVLQEAGYLEDSEHQNGVDNLTSLLISKGWIIITDSSQIQAGDILTYSNHVEIYAGDGKIYNAGSGKSIRGASPSNVYQPFSRALRAPN